LSIYYEPKHPFTGKRRERRRLLLERRREKKEGVRSFVGGDDY
jgi:hypothetical protein